MCCKSTITIINLESAQYAQTLLSFLPLHKLFSQKQPVDYLKAKTALSKFVSSVGLIDLATEDLICLQLGEVSHDRALVFYPLQVAASLRQRG